MRFSSCRKILALLKEEQVDDDSKKEYCEMSLDKADDMKKVLERSVSKLEKAIDEAKETIATLTDEIKALAAGIVALDKSVAEATEQRINPDEAVAYGAAVDAATMVSHLVHGYCHCVWCRQIIVNEKGGLVS